MSCYAINLGILIFFDEKSSRDRLTSSNPPRAPALASLFVSQPVQPLSYAMVSFPIIHNANARKLGIIQRKYEDAVLGSEEWLDF